MSKEPLFLGFKEDREGQEQAMYLWGGHLYTEKGMLKVKEKSFSNLPPEEHRKISSEGGRRSGEVRREKAKQRKELEKTARALVKYAEIQAEQYCVAEEVLEDFKAFRRSRAQQKRRQREKEERLAKGKNK